MRLSLKLFLSFRTPQNKYSGNHFLILRFFFGNIHIIRNTFGGVSDLLWSLVERSGFVRFLVTKGEFENPENCVTYYMDVPFSTVSKAHIQIIQIFHNPTKYQKPSMSTNSSPPKFNKKKINQIMSAGKNSKKMWSFDSIFNNIVYKLSR